MASTSITIQVGIHFEPWAEGLLKGIGAELRKAVEAGMPEEAAMKIIKATEAAALDNGASIRIDRREQTYRAWKEKLEKRRAGE